MQLDVRVGTRRSWAQWRAPRRRDAPIELVAQLVDDERTMAPRTAPLFLALVLAGCGAKLDGSTASATDAADSGALEAAADTANPGDDVDATYDAPITPDAPPLEIAATTTVRLAVKNGSGADRWIATTGTWCEPTAIDRLDASGVASHVARGLGFECLCECPNPGGPFVQAWRKLGPGESVTLDWDGRALVTYTTAYDCSTHGWPGQGVQAQLNGALQPTAPGKYRVTIDVASAPPTGCSQTASLPEWTCSGGYPGSPGYPGSTPPTIMQLCPAGDGNTTASATFDLPASGAIDVALTL